MNKHRVILITMFAAASIAIGYALYFFFFRTPITLIPTEEPEKEIPAELPAAGEAGEAEPLPEQPPATLPTAATLPTPPIVAQGGVTPSQIVVETDTEGLAPSATGEGVALYDRAAGTFFRINNDGTRTALSDERFFNVQSVEWSPNQSKAVLEYPDGFNIVYDFQTKKQVTLPQHWEQFKFADDGNKIAAISRGIHASQNWLLTVNPDGTNARAIEPLGNNTDKVIPEWSPDSQIVAFSKTGDPVGGEAQEIYLIGQNKENFKSLIVDGYGFQPKWSGDGKQLLYSTHSALNNYKPLLWVVDASGSNVGANRRELGISTWAEKCTFSSAQSVICAIPQVLPNNAGFAPAIANSIPDVFFKIDTVTGLKTPLAIPQTSVNAKNLTLSPDGQYLYFENTLGNTTERIRLK